MPALLRSCASEAVSGAEGSHNRLQYIYCPTSEMTCQRSEEGTLLLPRNMPAHMRLIKKNTVAGGRLRDSQLSALPFPVAFPWRRPRCLAHRRHRCLRYCFRAAISSVGWAAQLVRIVEIARRRPASHGWSVAARRCAKKLRPTPPRMGSCIAQSGALTRLDPRFASHLPQINTKFQPPKSHRCLCRVLRRRIVYSCSHLCQSRIPSLSPLLHECC